MTTTKNIHNAQIDDILVSTWGYEQTNCYFYKVLKVTKTSVTVQFLSGQKKGEILTKKTKSFSSIGANYQIDISSYETAYCELDDRQATKMHAIAEKLANDLNNLH